MTHKEALEVLHGLRPRGSIIPQKRAEMIDIADEAIRKQIPQKPVAIPHDKLKIGKKIQRSVMLWDEYLLQGIHMGNFTV